MKFPDLLLVLTIFFLPIDLSRPQLIPEGGDVLQLFRFYRGVTISLRIYQHKSVRITDGGRTTCANLCIDETSFTCRSFAFYQNPSTLDTECTWADGSPNTDGRLAFLQANQSKDLYMRIQNECDSFLVGTLPAKCPTPLGMKRGLLTDFRGYAVASDLADDQIVASSWAEEQFHPRNSRLDGPSCWKNTNRDLYPWIQVNLVERHVVTGLVVQGCGRDFLGWIQQFKVESKTNGNPFVEHVDRATGSEVIQGNTEPRCGKLVTFDPWLYADAIRIKPLQWYRSIGLRFEILGCKDDCDYSMGLTDGDLEDAAITASSVYNVESSPKEARIQPLGIQSIPTVGWKPGPGQTEWIQVRFPELRKIRAVTTQGCSQSFPKNFLLTYSTSTDSTNWKHFNYPNTNNPLDFVANSDDTTLMRHNLPYEFLALLVRITPTGWGGVGRCFKFELVGCVHQDCNEQLNIGRNGGAIQAQGALTCSPQSFSIHGDSSSNLQNTPIAFPATIQASLMITLIGEYTITGIISQGSINDREYGPTWANKYTLQYARDVNDGDSHGFRNYLKPDGSIQVFSANFDSVTPVTNHLIRPIAATRLQVTYYNDDVIYPKVPCIRLDFLGCAVSEYGHICGSSAVEVGGYCMATIANSDPGSCSSVFHATSYPAIVKSSSFSSLISDVLKSISPPGYDTFHIGLRQKQDWTEEGSLYEWVDGTPLLYNQFNPSYIPHDEQNTCPSISIHDRTYWETPACNTPSQVVGTLCQFDLDECAQSTSGCSHGCLNYPGGFTCQCSRGMYLDSENIKECKPLCNFRDMESLLEVFPDSCFKFHTTVATYDNAVETCNQTNGSLVGPHHYFNLVSKEWEPRNSPPSFIWRQGTPYKPHTDGPLLCNVGLLNTAPPPEPRILLSVRPCDHQYQFICVYDAPSRYVLEPSEHNQTTALKTEASYISWVGIPPWFDQLKTAFLDILVTNGLIIKFKMLSVNLRVNGQDTCLDKLLITEHLRSVNDTYHRPLCGNLPEFDVLTKTNHVGISLQIGQLTEWNTELSVKFYYDAHDCSLTECDYTCPTEDSPITESNGVLMSWRHPRILPPAYSCRWTIISKPNVYVRLDFFTVSVEAHYPIKVFARRLNGSQLNENSYVTVTSPVWIMSETTKVIITYETGLMHKANGFRVHHGPTAGAVEAPGCEFLPKDVKSSCPKTECNQPKAYLASPNFPNLYSLNECQYVITTSPGSYVWFLPREVYFEGDASCIGKLELWDSRVVYVICSRTNFQPLSAKGNVLTVAYKPSSFPGKFYGIYEERYFETPNYDHITEKDLDFTCPPNWRLFNGRCFFVANHPENLRWNEALWECRSIGNASSELASIRNTAEMNFVQGLLVKDELGSTIYYIGLTMNLQSSAARYEWVDGLPVSYTDWYISPFVFSDKQPDGGTAEACTAIDIRDFTSTKNWVDVPCADPLTDNYICAQQAEFKGSDEVSRPAITFHTEECGANFVRVGSQCLLMVPKHPDPNNTNLCQDETRIVGRSFVENNLERMRNYHENVWYLPGWRYVMVDHPYSHKPDSAPCYRVWNEDIVDCDIGSAYVLCVTEMSVMYQTCKGDQFPCSSGECISSSFVNDLTPDCRDGSDEMTSQEELSHEDIRTRNCLNPSFLRCGDNRCIPGYLFCDFKEDCFDGSDERNCVFPSCAENEFTCNSGECIPHNKTCDLLMDCLDGSDETECDGYTTDSVFQCYSGRTLPSYLYCDGYRDCSGKIFEDEPQNCDYLDKSFVCDELNQITCDNKACTNRTNVCMMADDEYGYTSGCRDVRHLKNCDLFECTHFTFKCPQSYCIPQHYRCNGRADCPGREDEEYCETYICEGAYRCHRSIICLSQHHVCDGIKHCPEGDDELFCDQSCPSGCLCFGSSYNCTDMEWDRHAAELVPYDIKQLYLSFLKKRQRVTRTINTDINISISIATFIDVHDFPFLIYLDLSGNGINFIANGTFVSNPNLRVLNMSYNNLYFINSGTFFGLDKLRILDLRGNKNLKDALWSPFQHFQVLKELYLQDTTIVTSDPEIIRGLDVIRIFQSDRFYYCCLLDEHEYLEECLPKQGDFSSCTSLIRNQALRIGMWILGMAALCGNLAVITWRLACQIVFRRQQRNPVQTFFVLNLAVADLFMGFYMLLIASADVYFRDTYALYSDQWQTSFFCRFAGFLSTLSSVSSVMFLTVISVDRCQNVAFPFSRRHLRRHSAYVVACCVWAVVMFIGILPAVVYGGAYYGRSSVCLALPITEQRLDGWAFSFAVFIILTLFLFFVIVSCYVGIFIVAHKSSKTSRNVSMSDQQHKREQLQMAAKVAFLVGTDFACWVPIIIMGFLSLNANAVSGDLYAVTAVFILPVNSALNPYLYTFLVERASALAKKKSTLQTTSRDSEPAKDHPLVHREATRSVQDKVVVDSDSEVVKTALASLRTTRIIGPLSSDKFKKNSLSEYMLKSNFTLEETEKEDIIRDLSKALEQLHNLGLTHGDVKENHVIIDESSYGNKRAFLLMTSHRPVHGSHAKSGTEEDKFHQDLLQLRDLGARLNNMLSSVDNDQAV